MGYQVGASFPASFDSECPVCDSAMWEGDLVGYVDNEVVCDACWNEADLENERELMVLRGETPGLLPGHTTLEPALQAVVDKARAMEAQPAPAAPAIDVAALVAAGKAKLEAEQQAEAQKRATAAGWTDTTRALLEAEEDIWQPRAQPAAPGIDVAALVAAGKAKLEADADAQERAEAAGWADTTQVDPWHAANEVDPWPPITPAEFTVEGAQADLLLKAQEIPAEPLPRLEYALDRLAPYRGGKDPDKVMDDTLDVIRDAIHNHPRSLQVEIGPSEIGTECDHCLAAKLAGWKEKRSGAWLPTIGTAMHSWLQETFEARMRLLPPEERRWLVEAKVFCGVIGGVNIFGSTDLLDLWYGQTTDWKLVGTTTLTEAKKIGASNVYRIQQQIYAHGWNMAGVRVDHCGIMYLPRNSTRLEDAYPVFEKYDPDVALAAFERANKYADMLAKMAHLPTEQRDAFISLLPRKRDKHGAIDCYDCKRYSDYPAEPLDQTMGGLVAIDD